MCIRDSIKGFLTRIRFSQYRQLKGTHLRPSMPKQAFSIYLVHAKFIGATTTVQPALATSVLYLWLLTASHLPQTSPFLELEQNLASAKRPVTVSAPIPSP